MLLLAMLASAFAVDAARVDVPIEIDGRMDEAAWDLATPVTDFVKFSPIPGGPPPGPTEVRFLYDDDHLYVGVRMEQGRTPRYRWAPREDLNQDDQIGIFLDTFVDRRSCYALYLNPLGVQQDLRVNGDRWNFYWDTVMRSAGQVDGERWVLEVAIPFRSLKYPSVSGEQEWGLVLQRIDVADLSLYGWPIQQRNDPNVCLYGGPLRLEPPPQGSGLELMPTLTAIQQATREQTSDPLEWTGVSRPFDAFRPSIDARFGITPNVGFTGTLNPDFSQVENDETPIDLNERFAFYFEERRPFFLDGSDLFEDRHDILYSRSIVEPIAGAKIGGKEGDVSVGVLHAVDRSPGWSIHEHGAPGFRPEDVDGALAANTIARIALDTPGGGYVGATYADKRLLPKGGGPGGYHGVGGVDFRAQLGNRWVAGGGAMGSHTGAQGQGALTGYGVSGELTRYSGVGTGGGVWGTYTHPDLRMETGFLTQTGLVEGGGRLDHTFEPGFVDTLMPQVQAYARHEVDGDGWAGAEARYELHEGALGHGAWFGRQRVWEDDLSVEGFYGGTWLWGRPTGFLEVQGEGGTARVVDYFRFAPAQSSFVSSNISLWPTRHIRWDTSLALRWLSPEDDPLERSMRLRSKLGYQFTRTLGARVIGEYSGGTVLQDRVIGSVLLTWLLHPGTGVWLGYAETGVVDEGYLVYDRTVFAKVSVLVRP